MKENVVHLLLKGKYRLDILDELTQYYARTIAEPQKELDVATLIGEINSSPYLHLLMEQLELAENMIFPCTAAHGKLHTFKVMLFSYYLAVKSNLDEDSLLLLLKAARYHDMGRTDDGNNLRHGGDGADCFIKNESQDDDVANKIVMFLIEAHSVPDEMMPYILISKGLPVTELLIKMVSILKDADALDRFRLHIKALDTRYLRLEESKKIILSAFLINHLLLDIYLRQTKSDILYHTSFDDSITTLYPTENLDMYGEHRIKAVFATEYKQKAYMYVLHGAQVPLYSFRYRRQLICFVPGPEELEVLFKQKNAWLYYLSSKDFMPVISYNGDYDAEWISLNDTDVTNAIRKPIRFRDLIDNDVIIYYPLTRDMYKPFRNMLQQAKRNDGKKELVDYWIMQKYICEYKGEKL